MRWIAVRYCCNFIHLDANMKVNLKEVDILVIQKSLDNIKQRVSKQKRLKSALFVIVFPTLLTTNKTILSRHLITPTVFLGVRVSLFVYLTCKSYLNFETDYFSVSVHFICGIMLS
jgi:hypothetical protein